MTLQLKTICDFYIYKTKTETDTAGRTVCEVFANMSRLNNNLIETADDKQISWSEGDAQSKNSADEKEKLYPNYDVTIWLRSCNEEIVEPMSGVITGNIPKWLNGSLIQNGPGSIKVGNEEYAHLFDGSAMLYRYGIKNGNVTYQCRFLQSETYKRNKAANRIVYSAFGTRSVPDPCHTIFDRIAAMFKVDPISDNNTVSVYPFNDELYAFGETSLLHKINPETLASEGALKVDEYISIINFSSHPHVTSDGTVYNLGMSVINSKPHHIIACFPNDKESGGKSMFQNAKIVASVRARWPMNPAYMHTFGITDNYFIIVEQPCSLYLPELFLRRFKHEPVAGCFRWYPKEYTRFSILSRKTGNTSYTFYAEAIFYFHIIQQYEIEDHIVIDICVYEDSSVMNNIYFDIMKEMQHDPEYAKKFRAKPIRFVLPLKPDPMNDVKNNLVRLGNTETEAYYLPNGDILVTPEDLCSLYCEMPKINYENYLGKPYRYFYAFNSNIDSDYPGCLIKVDTYSKTAKTFCEQNCYLSEPTFVPNPDSKFEDDGIILASMIWSGADTHHTGLLVLDAKTFTEIGRADFRTPVPVPKNFHGWFMPQKL